MMCDVSNFPFPTTISSFTDVTVFAFRKWKGIKIPRDHIVFPRCYEGCFYFTFGVQRADRSFPIIDIQTRVGLFMFLSSFLVFCYSLFIN